MPIRIESAIYQNLPRDNSEASKFQTMRYNASGQLDYTVGLAMATAWSYTVLVSASASALGGGVSAGGVDSLRTSWAKVSTTGNANQIQIVSDEAVTATAYFSMLQMQEQLNPTQFLYRVGLTKVQ